MHAWHACALTLNPISINTKENLSVQTTVCVRIVLRIGRGICPKLRIQLEQTAQQAKTLLHQRSPGKLTLRVSALGGVQHKVGLIMCNKFRHRTELTELVRVNVRRGNLDGWRESLTRKNVFPVRQRRVVVWWPRGAE